MKDKILELRSKGYTYNQIVEELGCSKGTVSYHCGDGQAEKSKNRVQRHRNGESGPVKIKPQVKCSYDLCSIITSQKYCSKECSASARSYDHLQSYLNGTWDGNTQHGISATIRRYVLELNNYSCSVCGWNEVHPDLGYSPVEVDHKDGNSYNQSLDNLIVLCPNHHALTGNYKALNKGSGRTWRTRYKQFE